MVNFYVLETINSTYETLHASSRSIKQKLTNENPYTLWHKWLGHICKERIDRLVIKGILDTLDYSNGNKSVLSV